MAHSASSTSSCHSVIQEDGAGEKDKPSRKRSKPAFRPTSPYHRNSPGLDPPRPAKEGFEWVWFPEGYWAEREFKSLPQPASETGKRRGSNTYKGWKKSWRRKSLVESGSGSDRDTESHDDPSPLTEPPPAVRTAIFSPQSRFLSEEAHVHSLQYPDSHPLPLSIRGRFGNEGEWLSPNEHDASPDDSHIKTSMCESSQAAKCSHDIHKSRYRLPSRSWRLPSISAQSNIDDQQQTRWELGKVNETNRDPSADSVRRPSQRSIPDQEKETDIRAVAPEKDDERPAAAAVAASRGNAARLRLLFGRDRSLLWRKWKSRRRSSLATSSTVAMPPDGLSKMIPVSAVQRPLPADLTQIWASQFPGGEAVRIHTPPLKEDTVNNKPRGLFFDLNSQADTNRGAQSPVSTNHPVTPGRSRTATASPVSARLRSHTDTPPTSRKKFVFSSQDVEDTVESDSEAAEGGKRRGRSSKQKQSTGRQQEKSLPPTQSPGDRRRRARSGATYSPFDHHRHGESLPTQRSSRNRPFTFRDPFPKAALFTFDIPEHLPSSPICPAHPKNKSGGKGVCVYHGRRQSLANDETEEEPPSSDQDGNR
ncbi:hypothetical protein V8F33_002562 [Rhypophila sp. PSN 637]